MFMDCEVYYIGYRLWGLLYVDIVKWYVDEM